VNISSHVTGTREMRLTLAGELDLATTRLLGQHVEHALATAPRRLLLDLAGVTFCDSTGVGALCEARTAVVERGVRFVAVNPGRMTRRIMRVTGLLALLTTEAP